MTDNRFLSNSLKLLKVIGEPTVSDITNAYLNLTWEPKFRKIFILNEDHIKEFIRYHEAWVLAINELTATSAETSPEFYPPGQLYKILFNQGLYHLLKGNLIKAGEKLEDSSRMNSGDFPTQIYLGVILKKRKNYYAAERYFLKAIEMDPENEYGWFFLANTYASANKLNKASSALRKVETLSFYNNEIIAVTRDLFREIEKLRMNNSRKSIISRVFKK